MMSTPRQTIPLLMLTAVLLAAPVSAWSQAAPKAPAVKPLVGKEPPFCETCGIIIAINRVPAEQVAKIKPSGGHNARLPDKFEVVIRLDAGTQQVVTLDLAPQLKIGQKVKIVNGVVVPELA